MFWYDTKREALDWNEYHPVFIYNTFVNNIIPVVGN